MKYHYFIIIFSFIYNCYGIKVYQSTLAINAPSPQSGLRLQKESVKKLSNFESGLSLCGRFNYKLLGDAARLFVIEGQGWSLMWSQMQYKATFISFGDSNWIIKDVEKNTFRIWMAYKWHHMCLSYDRVNKHITFVKVTLELKKSQHFNVACVRMEERQTLTSSTKTSMTKASIQAFWKTYMLGKCRAFMVHQHILVRFQM